MDLPHCPHALSLSRERLDNRGCGTPGCGCNAEVWLAGIAVAWGRHASN